MRAAGLDAAMRRAVALYAALVMLPMLLVFLPFWLTELDFALPNVLTLAFMWLPVLAALVVVKTVVRPASSARFLAVTPVRPGRLLAWAAGILAGAVVLVLLTLALSQALGFTRIDVLERTGYRSGDPPLTGDAARSEVLRTLLVLPVGYLLLTTGEELGWRGLLHRALEPLGFWRTAASTAALWVAWHLPLLVTTASFGDVPPRDAAATAVNLALAGVVLTALRARSGSVWPAAFAHAMLNTVILFGFSALRAPTAQDDPSGFWGFTAAGWAVWLVALLLTTAPWWRPGAQRADRPA